MKSPQQLLDNWADRKSKPKPEPKPKPAPTVPARVGPQVPAGIYVGCASCGKPGAWLPQDGVVLHDYRAAPEPQHRVCEVRQT